MKLNGLLFLLLFKTREEESKCARLVYVCACIKWHAKHSRNANIFARWGKELEMYLN